MMEIPGKCASPELLSSLTSSLMMTNHCFILIVILVSFFATYFALQKLRKQNIFPNCTRILLWSAIFNGVVHQLTVAEIRIKTIFRTLLYVSEPCLIQFQSTECVIENNIYYYTNLFTSLCCISLFFDRLFSINPKYSNNYKLISAFLVFQTVTPALILYWVYYGAQYTSYVAMCNYPPGLSAPRFYIMNNFRLYILGTFFVLSLVLFYYNRRQERRIIHKVYDTKSRYKTYENLLATQVVCVIVAVQAACLVITATGSKIVELKDKIRQLVHVSIYSNDPCQIEFHSPECTIDQSIYAFSNVLSTALGSGLTCDRFIAFFAFNLYHNQSKIMGYFLLLLSMSITSIIHLYTYGGVSRAGYVPSCQYPPQLSLDTFESVNNATFWFIMANCVLTGVVLLLNIHKNNKIKNSVFETRIRYNSFENLLTTKAICSISFIQFAFLSLSTAAVTIISTIEAGISEEVFHLVAQSLTGLVYANLSIPIFILFKTKKCIEQRRKSIEKMTNNTNEADCYMTSLRASWEKI